MTLRRVLINRDCSAGRALCPQKSNNNGEPFSGICEDGVEDLRFEMRAKRDPIAPQAVILLSHSCVDAQLTSHMGNLKVRELCLAAFAAAWAIDGNARRSSAG
jgi:hypothetical protein